MLLLRARPAAEIGDRDEFERGELAGVARRHLRIARPVEMPGDDLLAFLAVEVAEIGLGDLPRAALENDLVDDGNRRLRQDTDRGNDDLQLVRADLAHGQVRLVLPREQDIAYALLYEGRARGARPGVELGHVVIELA